MTILYYMNTKMVISLTEGSTAAENINIIVVKAKHNFPSEECRGRKEVRNRRMFWNSVTKVLHGLEGSRRHLNADGEGGGKGTGDRDS